MRQFEALLGAMAALQRGSWRTSGAAATGGGAPRSAAALSGAVASRVLACVLEPLASAAGSLLHEVPRTARTAFVRAHRHNNTFCEKLFAKHFFSRGVCLGLGDALPPACLGEKLLRAALVME